MPRDPDSLRSHWSGSERPAPRRRASFVPRGGLSRFGRRTGMRRRAPYPPASCTSSIDPYEGVVATQPESSDSHIHAHARQADGNVHIFVRKFVWQAEYTEEARGAFAVHKGKVRVLHKIAQRDWTTAKARQNP